MVYLDGALSAAEMAGLYAACDCLAQPYRGEGFGLPMVEAMACGLPVVVTGLGAALDYCDDDTAYLLPASGPPPSRAVRRRVGDGGPAVAGRARTGRPGEALLAAARRGPEAKAKGAAGRARVLAGFTWEHSAAAVMRRLEELRRRPIRRLRLAAGPVASQPPCCRTGADGRRAARHRPRTACRSA